MIWKSAILLWVAFFLVKYLVRVNISREDGTGRPFEVDARKSSAYDCIFCSDYHEPCNVGMVPIFCVINYK